jgi:hypothetical protein
MYQEIVQTLLQLDQHIYQKIFLALTNNENLVIPDQISIMPTLGIKRNIGKRFDYEIGGGFGYRYILEEIKHQDKKSEFAINILLRIGYKY